MQAPTVYRFPTKSMKPNTPSTKALRLWKKHRVARGKRAVSPQLKK